MKYDFDRIVSRRGTCSLRWDTVVERYGEPDLIPLTTADMDFPVAPPIQDALRRAVDHGIYGYSHPPREYFDAVVERFARQWRWEIRPEWIMRAPGVVNAIAYCLQSMTNEGDGVVMPVPMYHPFAHIIENNRRVLLRSPLRAEEGYTLDFEDLERQASDPRARVLLFCNPHNPIGRAWTLDELTQVCGICVRHNLLLICDEIHSAFVYAPHRFTSMATAALSFGPETQERLIICSSASKAYNLAGLPASDIIIPSEKLRELYTANLMTQYYMSINLFSMVANPVAYRECDDWLAQLVEYLQGSRDYIVDFLRGHVPSIVPVVPEATYMIWLDCRALGMSDEELDAFFLHKVKVSVNIGSTFGPEATGFVRMNFATPRPILREVMRRLETAVGEL